MWCFNFAETNKYKVMSSKSLKIKLVSLMFLFLSFGATAQNGSEVLSHIENTEEFKTVELAHMDMDLSIFVNLVHLSGLATGLEFTNEHTVFIPTNEAFGKMSLNQFAELTNPKNREQLRRFVRNHVIPEKVMLGEFQEETIINTQGENEIAVSVFGDGGQVTIGGAEIIKADIEASNGIIHIVSDVVEADEDIVMD